MIIKDAPDLVQHVVASPLAASLARVALRPISLLRFSLQRLVDSRKSGELPMDMGIPPLKILLESNPMKSIILVGRLGILV